MDSLLMHVFALITHISSLSFGFLCSFSFSFLFTFFSFLSFDLSVSVFRCSFSHYSQLQPFIMSAVLGFTIFTPQPLLAYCGRPSKIVHWPAGYPATTTTLCWLGHTSFPDKTKHKSDFVLSLTFLNTLIRITVMPFPYQPLWHVFSDSSSCFLLLGKMSSQHDISPKSA